MARSDVHLGRSWAFLILCNCDPVAIPFLSIDLLQKRVLSLVLLSSEVLSLNHLLDKLDVLIMKLRPPVHCYDLIRLVRSSY